MPEPRFRAEPDSADTPTQWWVLDAENPDIIRAQFHIQPNDVATAQELANETAKQMNARHEDRVRRAQHTAVVLAWTESLSTSALADLSNSIQKEGSGGLYAVLHAMVNR